MRFYHPVHDERRTKRWFAFFPVTIKSETRWLENVTVTQRHMNIAGVGGHFVEWQNVDFVDNLAKKNSFPSINVSSTGEAPGSLL